MADLFVRQVSYWMIEAARQESMDKAILDRISLYGDAVAIAIAGRQGPIYSKPPLQRHRNTN